MLNVKSTWAKFKSDHPKLFGEAEPPAPAVPTPEAPQEAPPAIMKVVGEEMFPATDFLSVPDPANPETWSLQVRRNGAVDAELLAAAKMALMGDGYVGEDKPAMIEALKMLYTEAGLEWPGSTAAECQQWAKRKAMGMRLAEMYYGDMPYSAGVPWGAKTFADIKAINNANAATDKIAQLAYQLCELVGAAMRDDEATDKRAVVSTLADDFKREADSVLGALASGEKPPEATTEAAATIPAQGGTVQFKESAACDLRVVNAPAQSTEISEAEIGTGRRGPVDIEIIPIQPGPGNKADNNYYTAAMLKRAAPKMVGKPLYSTDHDPKEKSERTKTGVVREVIGFTDNGSPRLRVTVFEPNHAEKVRNQAESDTLGSLECSIYASGTSHPAEVDGVRRNVVDDITEFHSIDWVTRAGAGGHVAGVLSESASGTQPNTQSALSESAVIAELAKYPAMTATTKARILQHGAYTTAEEVHKAADTELTYLREHSARPPDFSGTRKDTPTLSPEARAKLQKDVSRLLN